MVRYAFVGLAVAALGCGPDAGRQEVPAPGRPVATAPAPVVTPPTPAPEVEKGATRPGATGSTTFFGVPATGRVVFCTDASGSMLTKFDKVRVGLRDAVENLEPGQAFNLIFFQEDS